MHTVLTLKLLASSKRNFDKLVLIFHKHGSRFDQDLLCLMRIFEKIGYSFSQGTLEIQPYFHILLEFTDVLIEAGMAAKCP